MNNKKNSVLVAGNKIPVSARVLIYLLLGIIIIFILIITRHLLVPLFFAILFAYALYPAANKLESAGFPRIFTNLFLIITALVVIAGGIYGITILLAAFGEDLPRLQEQLTDNLMRLRETLEGIGVSDEQFDSLTENLYDAGEFIGEFFTATANTVLIIGLIPVYTFLMLFYRNKFRVFISMAFTNRYENVVQKIIDQAAEVVPKYIKGLVVVCLVLVVINSTGFYLIGVQYALLMGIIAAFFNLIPYLGTVIGYVLVFIFVLATQSVGLAAAVAVQFFIVQFFENNILTPNITGSYVQINPLVIIFSLIAGGMIWGLPGMFMIIPYLAMLKIVCDNIPGLQPVSYLMGTKGTEKHLISLDSIKKKLRLK